MKDDIRQERHFKKGDGRIMKDEADSGKRKVKTPGKIKWTNLEYAMIFCSNCNGSGKYFYGNKGASVCETCGGFGLVKTDRDDALDAFHRTVCV